MDTLINYCLCIALQCPGLYGYICELLSMYCVTMSMFIWIHLLIIVYILCYNVQVYMDTLINYCLCIALQCPGLYGYIHELLSMYCVTMSRFIWTHLLIIVYLLCYNVHVYKDTLVNYCISIVLQCSSLYGHIHELLSIYCVTMSIFLWTH